MRHAAFVLLLALAASSNGQSPEVPTFVDRAEQAGIRAIVVSGDAREKRFLLESIGGGLAVLDYDNDGWMDLYVAGGGTIESARSGAGKHPGALYRNNRDGTFTDVTAAAGISNKYWGKGALSADFNNDGWMDLYLCNYGPNILYLNNGNGTFRDATARAGVGDPRWSSAAAAADFDRDGKLDLFVANYLDYDVNHLPVSGKFCSYRGIPVACGPRGLKGAGDTLYRNNGDGTFTDVSLRAGVSDPEGYYGLGAAWGDYDNDGWPDLFVANDTTPNYLYHNNHDGTFTDVAVRAGVAFSEDGRAQAGMGVELEDLDNDGWLDIMVTNFSDDYNTLHRNTGKGSFRDDSYSAGIAADSFRDLSWGVGFYDFNNDGFKDVFIANGHIYPQVDRYGLNISYRQQNKLYLNLGGGKLRNVNAAAGSGLAIAKSHRGAAFADFNNDGWIDVAVVALDERPTLLMNQGVRGKHWILVRLVGTASNRFGIGARITVKAGGLTQTREVKAGGSFASSNDPRAHFGLGGATLIDELVVAWPSGKVTRQASVPADRLLTIEEGK
ncbi:MAG: hypothetical protein DMG07_08400 [Acidobacteria bacterium]|nr:MAG: hypothetical protein DMG07_08400 [Acidobacteriota bacterium]